MEFLNIIDLNLTFSQVLWLLVGSLVIHELEEWNIADFECRNFTGLPKWHNPLNARIWIVVICAIVAVWCVCATVLGNPSIAAYGFIPALMIMAGNALQHLIWTIRFRQCAPGLISGLLLVLPLSAYAVIRALELRIVSLWYVAVLALVIGTIIIHTIKLDGRAPGVIHGIYRIGDKISRLKLIRQLLSVYP